MDIPYASYIEAVRKSRAGTDYKKQMPSRTKLAHLLFSILADRLPIVDFSCGCFMDTAVFAILWFFDFWQF